MATTSLADIKNRPQARATVRYLRRSPYKVRAVLDLIRGKSVEEARVILEFCEREAATEILKLLESAAANAENNHGILADECYVAVAFADEGPTMKRFRPRARGRAGKIRKRTSHITLILARYTDAELTGREGNTGSSGAAARRRDLRRRRVEAQAAAEQHDHDHDHDHDHVEDEAPKAKKSKKKSDEASVDAAAEEQGE